MTHRLEFMEAKLGFSFAYVLSVALGIAGAICFNINALSVFGIADSGVVGQVLTGLLASAGSNYAHNKLRHVVGVEVSETVLLEDGGNDNMRA